MKILFSLLKKYLVTQIKKMSMLSYEAKKGRTFDGIFF